MKVNRHLIPTLREMYRLYLDHPEGLGDSFISLYLHISRRQVSRYRLEMPGVYQVGYGRYSCAPTLEQIELAETIMRRAEHDKARAADGYERDDA